MESNSSLTWSTGMSRRHLICVAEAENPIDGKNMTTQEMISIPKLNSEVFKCPECDGAVVYFDFAIWICPACHERRTRRQAETGHDLLTKLVIENVRRHSDENPL